VGILAIDLFLVVFDTYFLRSRHYFAGKFYPDRVRPRAVWLYNHILRRRGPFLKFVFFNVYQNSKNTFQSSLYDVIVARSVPVWLSGNALASINVVALRQTRLVPGWVTVCGRVSHLGM